MKVRIMVVALAAVGATFALHAQEKVVGSKTAESMFTSADPKLHKNKQAALHIMRELLQCGQWDRSAEWLTDAYHQHNPNAASGRQGVVDFFTKVLGVKRTDNCGPLTTEVVAVQAEGDFVTVVMPRTYADPRDSANAACLYPTAPNDKCKGKTYSTTWFDTWRFVDGKADEHWDSATIAPPAPR